MNSDLNIEKCIPCSIGTPSLYGEELNLLLKEINSDWKLVDEIKIERTFRFDNFIHALGFVNKVGALAEEEGHHPDIEFGWGKAKIILTTHKIKGLSRNDFILASKIDNLIQLL